MPYQGRIQDFRKGGGGGLPRAPKARAIYGVRGNALPEMFENLSLKIALHSDFVYCIVLYCIVLYCIVLHCIVLYCIVLYYIILY